MTIITVGTCVKNSAASIQETIQSIINQDFPHNLMELIVIDGQSIDNTISIISNTMFTSDIPMRSYSDQGKGLGEARQLVIDNARGDYVIWVDGDMVLPKNFIRKQVEFMNQNPQVGAVRGQIELSQTNYSIVSLLESLRETGLQEQDQQVITFYDTCRVKSVKDVGGFDKKIKGASEDRELIYRISKKGWLLAKSNAKFRHRFRSSWHDLWKEYSWWGYGEHYVIHKYQDIMVLWQTIPILRALGAIRRIPIAYKATHLKITLLLPIHSFFKSSAFWFGFLRGHTDDYGHKKK